MPVDRIAAALPLPLPAKQHLRLPGGAAGAMDQKLVVWVRGFRNQLLTLGAACSEEMKGAIANTLISVWDLKTNQPGENLRAGGVVAVRKALEDLLSGPLEVARPWPGWKQIIQLLS